MFTVTTDNDETIGYEQNSTARKLLNSIIIPVLNKVPAHKREKLRKTHEVAKGVIDNATTHSALEVIYNHQKKRGGKLLHRFFGWLWQGTNNAKAVRNRLRLVEKILRKELLNILPKKDQVSLLSIAAGSSRAFIEVLNNIKDKIGENNEILTTFLDKSPQAIEYSKSLTKKCTAHAQFSWVNDTVGGFFRSRTNEARKYDIIEMVGLMDYFEDQKAIETFTSIREALNDGGILITANIRDNAERQFLTNAVGWKMIYREAEELAQLIVDAGFSRESLEVYYEPMRIHSVIIARKC